MTNIVKFISVWSNPVPKSRSSSRMIKIPQLIEPISTKLLWQIWSSVYHSTNSTIYISWKTNFWYRMMIVNKSNIFARSVNMSEESIIILNMSKTHRSRKTNISWWYYTICFCWITTFVYESYMIDDINSYIRQYNISKIDWILTLARRLISDLVKQLIDFINFSLSLLFETEKTWY